ncbi:MAG: nucleotidyltransferase domain-containing protein [bacterium]|nr:nucleotidyltransferase domain-containing protein [bacterium]
MQKIVQKIYDEIVTQYKPDKNVLGIMVFGSAARDTSDEYSDIDFYIIVRKLAKFARIGLIKYGIPIDIIIEPINETNKYLNEDKNALKRNTSHMLAHSAILFQRSASIAKIQAIAKSNLNLKTKYTKEEILMHKYSIDDFLGEVRRDAKNQDSVAFGVDSQLLINNIMELFLKINGDFLRQPKELHARLNDIDKRFGNLVNHFYLATDRQDKIKILSALIKYIYTKTRPLPKKWSIANFN